jgi:dTDP-4-dehydrorhamnose reductase
MRVLSKRYPKHRYFFTDIAELDICNKAAVSAFVAENAIELIVNCAAYTNVDKAEEDEVTATKINAEALGVLGNQGVRVIHISTDYVFSGEEYRPCRETDPVAPHTIYGITKYDGEKRLLASCPEAVILRTAWLYSYYGKNFVKTIVNAGKKRGSLTVVNDQCGNPTNAVDLAHTALQLGATEEYGVYHCTGEGICSWYDFACAIIEEAGVNASVSPCTSAEYKAANPASADRPAWSALDNRMLRCTIGNPMREWRSALHAFFANWDGDNGMKQDH